MAQYLEPYCDEIVYDNLGSVFGVKKSKKENAKRVLVITHMDESGLMITKINDNGSAEFIEIGKINKQYLLGSRLRVKTKTGEVNAFVGRYRKNGYRFWNVFKRRNISTWCICRR
ncbi:MAG: hypothetical protein ACLTTH_10470 [Holdemanella porci]